MEVVYEPWKVVRQIGSGSFGTVYEIERNDTFVTYRAALKVIRIPHDDSEIESARSDGLDETSISAFFRSEAEEIVREINLMSQLKGITNIVSYEDHQIVENEDGIGWTILIRMELLTPLNKYMSEYVMTRQDVIRLGIDVCRALERCQKYNIIHRDIKPDNIFISPQGDYKLGDFGIARIAEKTTIGMSKKGTPSYMAPEVYRGEAYGHTVDIYSLGLVMYRLLNRNRAPFLPPYPEPITYHDKEQSLVRRLSGEPLPLPVGDNTRLAEIILKACSFEPQNRYSSAGRMREELEEILLSEIESNEKTIVLEQAVNRELTIPSMEISNRQKPEAGKKVCPFCGNLIDEKAVFCTSCGNQVPSFTLSERNEEPKKRKERKEKRTKILLPVLLGIFGLIAAGLLIIQPWKKIPQARKESAIVDPDPQEMITGDSSHADSEPEEASSEESVKEETSSEEQSSEESLSEESSKEESSQESISEEISEETSEESEEESLTDDSSSDDSSIDEDAVREGEMLSAQQSYAEMFELKDSYPLSIPKIDYMQVNEKGIVVLGWKAVKGAEKYQLFRYDYAGDQTWEILGEFTELNYLDESAVDYGEYYYGVRAIDPKTGEFLSSIKITHEIMPRPYPQDLSASRVGNGIELSWEEIYRCKRYRVFRRNDGNDWEVVGETTINHFTDNGVEKDKSYTYTVCCLSSSGKTVVSGYDQEGVTVDPIS